MIKTLSIAFVALLLAGCGEKDQSMTGSSAGPDTKSWEGADPRYHQAGWNRGDKVSWENHIRTRGQHQNEYNKTTRQQ